MKILSAKLFSVIILYLFIFCIASKYMYIVFLHTKSKHFDHLKQKLTEIAKIREINFVSNLFLNSDASLIVHGMKLNFSRFQKNYVFITDLANEFTDRASRPLVTTLTYCY